LPRRRGPGRPKRYCGGACRQAAYRARREAARQAGAGEVNDLADAVYVLAAALEDVEGDVTASSSKADLRDALDHLREAADGVLTTFLRA
jgi:hypothetical protein